MTCAITEEELASSTADLLRSVRDQTFLTERDGKPFAALISMAEYESTREARVERAVAAMNAFGDSMQSVTKPEELDAIEKELHQRAE